jgi:predicted transcriptional regulator
VSRLLEDFTWTLSVKLWYTESMNPLLTPEQSAALQAHEGELRVTDPTTQRVYVLVDDETHSRAMEALRRREDRQAIQAGIEDMEAGRMQPAEEAHRHGREELLSRFQS